jgi:hypothetical protein
LTQARVRQDRQPRPIKKGHDQPLDQLTDAMLAAVVDALRALTQP